MKFDKLKEEKLAADLSKLKAYEEFEKEREGVESWFAVAMRFSGEVRELTHDIERANKAIVEYDEENKRLREALEDIALNKGASDCETLFFNKSDLREYAKKALEGKDE